MFYRVRLLNDALDSSVAEIVPYKNDDGTHTLSVFSNNPKMKNHLDMLMMREAYVLSPGMASENFYADGVLRVYPGTVEFVQALPEVLAWSGYFCEYVEDTHKSIDFLDTGYITTLKSTDDNIYTNAQGERIVKRVPKEFIAVHQDGRMVAAGGWINANIDKEDALWTLVPNPYEQYTPEQRASEKEFMELLISEYHPGVHEDLYQARRTENDDFFYDPEGYQPESGKKLSEVYRREQPMVVPRQEAAQDVPVHLPKTLPAGMIVYSPDTGHVFGSELWPPTSIPDYGTMKWYLFNDNLTEEEKTRYSEMLGITSPVMAPGAKTAISQIDAGLDVSEATKLVIPGAAQSDIIINTFAPTKLTTGELESDKEFIAKAKNASQAIADITKLVKYPDSSKPRGLGLDPSLAEMEIEHLSGPHARFAMELYDHQKPAVAFLTEPSQYEVFGGPKGWHGGFVSAYYGAGKVQPNDEVVYTPHGPTTMGQLRPGDSIITETGEAANILEVFPHEDWQFNRIEFDDGSWTEVGDEHLWHVWNDKELANGGEGSVMTTDDIRKELSAGANLYIEMTSPVQFHTPFTKLPIAPYSLGRSLIDYRPSHDILKKRLGVDFQYIPHVYQTASLIDRANLMRGLLEASKPNKLVSLIDHRRRKVRPVTTGAVNKHVIHVTNKRLAEDIRQLALSLGAWSDVVKILNTFVVRIYLPESLNLEAPGAEYTKNIYRSIVSIRASRVADGACILIDSERHLYLTRDYIVTHNTAMVLAADAIMRNTERFEAGKQVTIVTCPNKQVGVWRDEVAKFRHESAYVIDGDRQSRVEQWEDLLTRARMGELPNIVITGGSRFRRQRNEGMDAEEEWELSLDAQYMKLLSLGGSSNGEEVEGGHISAMVVDESGQFVNYDAAKHKAINEVIDSIYQGGGITWTLNGDLSGNSNADTLSEISFVNKLVRDNYREMVEYYTKPDQKVRGDKLGRRAWKLGKGQEFMNSFRQHIFSLKGDVVVGDEWGQTYTPDVIPNLGHNWGKVYKACMDKVVAASGAGGAKLTKALGMMQLMLGASQGAVNPARIMEYEIGLPTLLKGVKKFLSPKDYGEFLEGMKRYQDSVTEIDPILGRVVVTGLGVSERKAIYNGIFNQNHNLAMEQALAEWDNPTLDAYMEGIEQDFSNVEAGKHTKIFVGNFNKFFLRALYHRLVDKYGNKVQINIIDGDTHQNEVAETQRRHNETKGKHVITLASGAGKYGLSLASSRTYRSPGWNHATARQLAGRAHRKAEQKNVATVVVPAGIYQYMRMVEEEKREREMLTRGMAMQLIEDNDEIEIKSLDDGFVQNLMRFGVKSNPKESSEG